MKKLLGLLLILALIPIAHADEDFTVDGSSDIPVRKRSVLFQERSTNPTTPPANHLKLFSKDKAGVSTLYTKDSAGTVTEVGAGGGGGGDSITVNSSAATDPDFADGDIDWTLTGGNSITATVECTGCISDTDLAADSVSASELNATGVESELESVIDLADLQGAVTDAQVPNNITIDLATLATTATTANAGDSATAFFNAGTIEHERGGLEADISAYDGLIGITGGATYNVTGTTTQIIIFDGAGAPTVAALSSDVTMTNAGVVTIANNAVALTTDTSGNYVGDVTAGVGLAKTSSASEGQTVDLKTDSSEADFLKAGALTCGAATQGKMQVHTTPLQYCDNAATPALQYSAYGNSTGESTAAANDSVALTTDTTGNYVASLVAGTAIDVSGASEGATPTVDWDSTEVEATTWGAGGNASNAWTFNLSGTDPLFVAVSAGFRMESNLQLGVAGTDGKLTLFAEDGATDHSTIIQPGTQTQDITLTLPLDDGDADQVLSTNGSGVLDWVTPAAGSGDVTDVGNCATGACFTGSTGTTLTSTTSEILDMATDGALIYQRNTSGSVTFAGKDDAGAADTIYDTTLAGAITVGSADVTAVTITTDGSGTAELVLPLQSVAGAEMLNDTITATQVDETANFAFTGQLVASGNPTVTGAGVIGVDTTDNQLLFGASTSVLSPTYSHSFRLENAVDTDDNFDFFIAPDNITITGVACQYSGTGTTPATFTLEDGNGNAMTITGTNPTCVAETANATYAAVTASNTLVKGETVRFDITNTPGPVTDDYIISLRFTRDRT